MITQLVRAESSEAVDRALKIFERGGLVAFPTDTVYGLGASAFDDEAIRSIYLAKDRPPEKAIPVLLADPADMDLVGMNIPDIAYKVAGRFWPGPLTCIIPKKSTLPESISATSTIGVRVPNHVFARALLRAAGPMAVTSANISGQESPISAKEVFDQLHGRIPLIVDGGITPGGMPSTVVDCTSDELKILREGPVSLKEIREKLSSPF